MRKSHLQMNPAFAQAHGLSMNGGNKSQVKETVGSCLEAAIDGARKSGHLDLVNAGIETTLPSELFELRATMNINYSMDHQRSNLQYTEETISVVDLSDNDKISGEFDERFAQFIMVQQLRFKRCQWKKMTVSLASLEFLKVLDLSGNQLMSFDMSLVPPGLQELDLSGNRLDTVSSTDASKVVQLQVLDVSNNNLKYLNECDFSCPDLRRFQCHHNSFSRFPTDFLKESIHQLESIDASYNMIANTLDFQRFKSLKKLNLGMNRLAVIPTIPLSLLTLDVTENMIKDIQQLLPASDELTPALIELMIGRNHLPELDGAVFERCLNLQRLDISSNKLKNLPYQLGLLPSLRAFRVASNPLFTLKRSDVENNPNGVLEVLRRRAPKREEAPAPQSSSILSAFISNGNSITLSVSKNQGRGIPSTLSLDPLVRSLQANPTVASKITSKLELNGFESIPGDLLTIVSNVSFISLAGNKLTSIAPQLATCSRLVHLDLSRNHLSDLSPLAGDLRWATTIKLLNLSANRIKEVPVKTLEKLHCLETLILMSNGIESLDRCTWLPSSLVHLELSENQIEDMDDLVWSLAVRCPKIQVLQMAQNKLKKIPLELGLFLEGSLKRLDLRMNPQQAVRHSILERGCTYQLSYLKNRMTKEEAIDCNKRLQTLKNEFSLVKQSVLPQSDARSNRVVPTEISWNASSLPKSELSAEREALLKLIAEYKKRMDSIQKEMDTNFSLSQAKRYALKKEMAMERSRLIKEERKLGLRK